MQKFKIFKSFNDSTTGATSSELVNSNVSLKLKGNYYVYTSEIGGDIVNENTVKGFLDADQNENLAVEFADFLQNNTSVDGFREIFNDNRKLSNVFNEYYVNNIVRNISVNNQNSIQSINSNLRSTQRINTHNNTVFNADSGNRNQSLQSVLIPSGINLDSYYIDVKLTKSFKLVERGDYSEFFKDTIDNTYNYDRYTYINKISGQTLYVNDQYFKQFRISNNIGYGATEEELFPYNFVGYIPHLGRSGFNYDFQTFSQFVYYWSFIPPVIIQNRPGNFLSFNNLNILNSSINFDSKSVEEYNRQNTYNVNLQVSDNSGPSTGSTYIIKAESYSTATRGVDFYLNPSSVFDSTIDINILPGNVSQQFQISITNTFDFQKSIILSIRNQNNRVLSFLLINGEKTQEFLKFDDLSFIQIDKINKNKLFINSFVDFNFNDNESEKWRNSNVSIVDNR